MVLARTFTKHYRLAAGARPALKIPKLILLRSTVTQKPRTCRQFKGLSNSVRVMRGKYDNALISLLLLCERFRALLYDDGLLS
ncbi:hypothetical protein SRHO_G00016380 [Serrasalmus rhombeus]